MIIDARIKQHHASELIKDAQVEKKVDSMCDKGGALYGIMN
jgi:4-hydroxy-3-polyprenylbenzoate decarboxylase